MLKQIMTWADGDDGRNIFWLSGWAGTGKSTIARSVSREYYNRGRRGANFFASFFFSRGDVSTAENFAISIAIQLAESPLLKDLIHKARSHNDGIVNKILEDQWQQLVIEPLEKIDADSVHAPLILVIDALDECDKERDMRRVIQLVASARALQTVRLRVLITSRPEIAIERAFSQYLRSENPHFILQDTNPLKVDKDIFLFLDHKFKIIARERAFKDWPGKHTIQLLVRKAAGLFIWAATAFRFIDEGKYLTKKRLALILEGDASHTQPEIELTKIYITVLKNSIGHHYNEQEKESFYAVLRKVVGSIVVTFPSLSTASLASLLHLPQEDVEQTLTDLGSILDVPKDQACSIRLHHPSFRDFWLDDRRCSDQQLWVDEKKTHAALANAFLQYFLLPFNTTQLLVRIYQKLLHSLLF